MPHTERAYTYEPLSQYPGLRPNDRAIWDAFLARHPKRFGRVFYDVHLGEHSQIEEGVHPRAASAWYDLTRWKLDVLAEDEAFVYAIEIKPEANAKAIGQALCYAC